MLWMIFVALLALWFLGLAQSSCRWNDSPVTDCCCGSHIDQYLTERPKVGAVGVNLGDLRQLPERDRAVQRRSR